MLSRLVWQTYDASSVPVGACTSSALIRSSSSPHTIVPASSRSTSASCAMSLGSGWPSANRAAIMLERTVIDRNPASDAEIASGRLRPRKSIRSSPCTRRNGSAMNRMARSAGAVLNLERKLLCRRAALPDAGHGRKKPVSEFRHGLDEAAGGRVVPQDFS